MLRSRAWWSKSLDPELLIRVAACAYRDQLKALWQHPDPADMTVAQSVEVELEPQDTPPCGSFRAFALYWASKMLLRYYSARGARRKVEVLFSELRARYPDLEAEEESGEAWCALRHT